MNNPGGAFVGRSYDSAANTMHRSAVQYRTSYREIATASRPRNDTDFRWCIVGASIARPKRLLLEEKLSPQVTDEVSVAFVFSHRATPHPSFARSSQMPPSPQGEGFGRQAFGDKLRKV